MTYDAISLIFIGVSLLAVSFVTTLIDECIGTLSQSEIAVFEKHHPWVKRALDYFKRRKALTVATLYIIRVPVLITGAVVGFQRLEFEPLTVKVIIISVYSFILVMFGFVVPRLLGNRFREAFGFIFAIPLWLFAVALYPLTFPMTIFCRMIDRRKPSDPRRIAQSIAHLAQSAAAEKAISKRQAQLITRTVELSFLRAADIMVKRSDIHPLSDTLSLMEALIEAHLHHHTRFPLVHDNDLDQVIGYVNFKDIVSALRVNPADPTLYGIKRAIESVDEATPLPDLLQKLTRGSQHIVIVKDSSRQKTLGMVTLEDLIETLVGDLEDEYDKPPEFIVQLADNRFRAGGGATFSALRDKVSAEFPDWDVTINEWISAQTDQKVPQQFSTAFGNCTFIVRKVARGKVFDVIIDRAAAQTSADASVKKEQ